MAPKPNAATVRLQLLDRDVLFRESLSSLLNAGPGLRVMSQCAAAEEAVEHLKHSPVDVLLVAWDALGESCDAIAAIAAVRMVAEGNAWVDRGLLLSVAGEAGNHAATPFAALPEREQRVLEAVVAGRTNREIAALVGVSEPAVKRTLRSLFEKTGARSRAALVRAALDAAFGLRDA